MSNLEVALDSKIKPLISISTSKVIGKSIEKLNEDISTKIKQIIFGNITIDIEIPFKDAKREFKKEFLTNLIKKNCGNVSEVARLAEIDRRSVYRLIDYDPLRKTREELPKISYIKQAEMGSAIEDAVNGFKDIIPRRHMMDFYEEIPKLCEEILRGFNDESITLKEAEEEFEKKYFSAALIKFDYDISRTAVHIGLRYETLHRKIKNLGIA